MFKKRKWGWWLVLWNAKYFKVKLIYFKKGGKLSMQRHEHRNELWCFLIGYGRMSSATKNNKSVLITSFAGELKKGDYTMISKNHWHQYKADKRTLVLEIQYGIQCNEEDIERKDD